MSSWKEIWNKDDRVNKIILDMLIKADGFDSPTGSFTVDDWIEYTDTLYARLNIKDNDSIFDVGSGSGAFVYPFYLKSHHIGGIEYSKKLVSLANAIMPDGEFVNEEAIEIDIQDKYNIIVSHGVFFYFKDLEYARKVIVKMIKKSNREIAIFDINDETKQEKYHQLRMQTMTKEEYEKKYEGLEHLFYAKEFFIQIAEEYNLKIEIWDQDFEQYNNSKFRFNVIMRKV